MSANNERSGLDGAPDDLSWEDGLDSSDGGYPYDEVGNEPGGFLPFGQAGRSGGIDQLGRSEAAVAGDVNGSMRVVTARDRGVVLSVEHVSFLVAAEQEILKRIGAGRTAQSWSLDGRTLRPRFVPPGGYENAVANLQDHRIVLLTGEEGTGRSAAAMMALLAADGRGPEDTEDVDGTTSYTIRDLPTIQEVQRDGATWPGPKEIASGERLRLHLTTPALAGSVTNGALQSLIAAVRERSARLAVVVSDDVLRVLPPEFVDHRVPLGRPDPAEVLVRHLSARDASWPAADTDGEIRSQIYAADSEKILATLSMETIARVAEAVRPKGPPSQWLAAALQATVGNPARLVEELRDKAGVSRSASDGTAIAWRLRLAAVAMLEDATTAMVVRAERELVRACAPGGRPVDDDHPFGWDEADEWLEQIGAERASGETPGSSMVRFRQPVYGIAARRYLWTEHPHLVEVYLSWFDRLAVGFPRKTDAGTKMTLLLAARLAEQMLLSADADGLLWLAEHWSRRSGAIYTTAAAMVFRLGLEDNGTAPGVRQRFYEWSRQDIRPRLARIVIESCGGPLAEMRPDMAAIRLLHFLGNADDAVADAAVRNIKRLADRADNYWPVLEKVLTIISAGRPSSNLVETTGARGKGSWRSRRNRRAAIVFLNLADPDLLTQAYGKNVNGRRGPASPPVPDSSGLAQDLARAWEAALSWPLDDELLVGRVASWLGAASGQDAADWLLDVLVTACGAREELQTRLCNLALEATRTAARRGGASGPRTAYVRLLEKVAHSGLNWMGVAL